MKKSLSILLAVLMFSGVLIMSVSAENSYPLKTEQISVRDPFVLLYEDKYYMYGTGLAWDGYGCVISEDLENWSEPKKIYSFPGEYCADGCFWAPECHYYHGCFYLFATYHNSITSTRGTAVFRSDRPEGPFEMISDGAVTPHGYDCIDGTLYVDPDGNPWIVYVREWTMAENETGRMSVSRLSEDLSKRISEDTDIFKADDPVWTDSRVTDGPFLYNSKNGQLLMIWSNNNKNGYCVGQAVCKSGKPDGKWYQRSVPLYSKGRTFALDGGHGMIFTDKDGELRMAIHSPNSASDVHPTTAVFLDIEDKGGYLALRQEKSFFDRIEDFFGRLFDYIALLFIR